MRTVPAAVPVPIHEHIERVTVHMRPEIPVIAVNVANGWASRKDVDGVSAEGAVDVDDVISSQVIVHVQTAIDR